MKYENWGRAAMMPASLLVALILSTDRPVALHRSAIESVATVLEAKVFRLKVDLHAPDLAGETMQMPTLEGRGWHHNNPGGAIILKSGTRVEVTGVFNYAERGLFLELAKEDTGISRLSITARPRTRIRIMVETSGNNPDGQQSEALSLAAKVLDFTTP